MVSFPGCQIGSAVDLIYTFVNADDAALTARRQSFQALEGRSIDSYISGPSRYRYNGELEYSIASAQRYLPFLGRIYIVHAGAAPSWLKSCFNIELINEEELLPAGVAPTFQSDVIECFLHRIPGLSEQYLYANDDYFFAKRHHQSDFFSENGHAKVALCDRFAAIGDAEGPYIASEINAIKALVRHTIPPCIVPVGTRARIPNLLMPRQRLRAYRRGLRLFNTTTHLTQPYYKSVWSTFHNIFQAEIDDLCSQRFRSIHGLTTNFMYHHYARSIGKAEFRYEPNHRYLDRRDTQSKRELLRRELLHADSIITQFCLNDSSSPDNDGWQDYIESLMKDLLGPQCQSGTVERRNQHQFEPLTRLDKDHSDSRHA